MKVTAINCLNCKDIVWSRATHDFRPCSCGDCFIDGGRSYDRMGFKRKEDVITGTLDTDTGEFIPHPKQ